MHSRGEVMQQAVAKPISSPALPFADCTLMFGFLRQVHNTPVMRKYPDCMHAQQKSPRHAPGLETSDLFYCVQLATGSSAQRAPEKNPRGKSLRSNRTSTHYHESTNTHSAPSPRLIYKLDPIEKRQETHLRHLGRTSSSREKRIPDVGAERFESI